MRPKLVLALGLVYGCGGDCAPFEAIAIRGGDASSRAIVRAAVDDFAGWTARDTVCVDPIHLVDALEADGDLVVLGRYDPGSGQIDVVEQPSLRSVTHHELCHALQDHDDIVTRFPGAFELDSTFVGGEGEAFGERVEAFALDCEVGPEFLAMGDRVAERCGAPTARDTFQVLGRVAYPGWTLPLVEVPVTRLLTGEVMLPEGFAPDLALGALASTLDTVLLVGHRDGVPTRLDVDVGLGPAAGAALPALFPALPPGTPTRRVLPVGAAAQGDAIWAAFRWRVSSGEILRFLAFHDGDRWTLPADPCLDAGTWVVGLANRPFLVEVRDGRMTVWALEVHG